eukprot:11064372-Alexandrium_andersonii.AAC.1
MGRAAPALTQPAFGFRAERDPAGFSTGGVHGPASARAKRRGEPRPCPCAPAGPRSTQRKRATRRKQSAAACGVLE